MREFGGQFDVVGGQHHPVPGRGQRGELIGEPLLGAVVQPAGRLIEQQQRRRAGEHDRQREAHPLPLRQIPGMPVPGHVGGEFGEPGGTGSGGYAEVGVCVAALLGDRSGIEQITRILRYQADAADQFGGLEPGRIGTADGQLP